MLVLILIVLGLFLRIAPHAPNFTPVAAIALFAGAHLNKKYAILIPLALMVISDLIIGMHNVALFTWGSFALTAGLGMLLKNNKSPIKVVSMSLISAVLFYAVSNFGVWAMGWYPPTFKGLATCYVMGLPFLRNFTAATLYYSAAFFALYELSARLARNTKYSGVLLAK